MMIKLPSLMKVTTIGQMRLPHKTNPVESDRFASINSIKFVMVRSYKLAASYYGLCQSKKTVIR